MRQHGSHEEPEFRLLVEDEPDTEGHVMPSDTDDATDDADDVTGHILLQVQPPRDEGGAGLRAR